MPSNPPSRERLDFLDVARGVAAVVILFEHGLHQFIGGYFDWSVNHVIVGQGAIIAFFLVSGFVIPMSLTASESVASFWVRRVFRLFPVFWVSLALAFVYLWCGGPNPLRIEKTDFAAWAANCFLLDRFMNLPDVWGVAWTLHFEVSFYVGCSVLFALGWLRRFGVKMFVTFLVAIFMACLIKTLLTKNPTHFSWSILASLITGMLANRYVLGEVSRRQFYALLAATAATLVGICLLNHALFPALASGQDLIRCIVMNATGYGLFLVLLELRSHPMPAAGCWLGRRSYPIYLLHPFVLILLKGTVDGWPAILSMTLLTAGTLALAEVVHRTVELPGIAAGRWVVAAMRRQTAKPATVPLQPVASASKAA